MPSFRKQMQLGEDGLEEPDEHPSTWDEWGVEVQQREPETKYVSREVASSFGVDDRPEVRSATELEQAELVANGEVGQLNLLGEEQGPISLW